MNHRRTLIVLVVLLVAGGLLFWNLHDVASPIRISDPKAVLAASGEGPAAVILTLENTGGPDVLEAVHSPMSDDVMLMGIDEDRQMAIPAGSKPGFATDGAHAMMAGLAADLAEGAFVPLVLEFERAGAVPVKARVSRGTDDTTNAAHGVGPGHVVGETETVPAIEIDVAPGKEGYRVTITTRNFAFHRPDTDSADHITGQVHAHLYLNGLKLQRMYDTEATIGELPPGRHTVRVTLNTNDQQTYLVDGEPVSAEAEIDAE